MKADINNIIELPVDTNIILPVVEDNDSNQDFTDKSDDNIINIIEQNKLEILSVIQENQKEIIDYIKKDDKYYCEKCDYHTNHNNDYKKHCKSKKHNNEQTIELKFECKICNKKYKGLSGLWAHKKICNVVIQKPPNNKEAPKISNEIINEKIEKQNQTIEELKNLIIELTNKK